MSHLTRQDVTDHLIICPADLSSKSRKAFLQEMIENFPENVKNRILAVKNLQLHQIKLSEQFFDDVYALEKTYYERSKDLFDEREKIITGKIEPVKQEKQWIDEEDEVLEEIKTSLEFRQVMLAMKRMPQTVRGIPKFWLTVFRNVSTISDWVQDYDEPLLEKLTDIRIIYDADSYMFEFHFDDNEYLTESVLTKRYFMRKTADDDNPFVFEGPEIYKCEGCDINWREGKNLMTMFTESRRNRNKLGGSKTQQLKSFFRFFAPPAAVDLSLADPKTKAILANDFDLGYLLRTQIVPKAVLFYTGDIVEMEPSEENFIEQEEQPLTAKSSN